MMLRYMQLDAIANNIETACFKTIRERKVSNTGIQVSCAVRKTCCLMLGSMSFTSFSMQVDGLSTMY